jgi:hypothetical protein
MKHAVTRSLYEYWDRLRAGRSAPERSDIDPGSIRTLLGDVFLLEFESKDRLLVRLAGTRICTLLGREWKSRPFSEPFAAEDQPELRAIVEAVTDTAVPAVAGIAGETKDGRRFDLELLLLPLRHRGRTNARLLGSLASGDWPYWAGQVPLVRFRLNSVRYLQPPGSAAGELNPVAPPPRLSIGRLRLLPGGRA